ncbi:MAG TPA: hypothetical protein VLX68_05950 [Chitinivibrionales bacterium]|nr:hypothetical protein [Chitinivibrionales bacterium]
MKALTAVAAALLACALVVSCSSPGTTNNTTPPPPGGSQFTVAASIDGTPYSAAATMTIATISSMYFVDVKSATGSQSLELLFRFPTNSAFPKNLNQSTGFTATYNDGAASYSDSAGTATVTVNSFSYSYADTAFSADFTFKAKGGTSTLTVKNFTAGTVRHN